MENSEKLRNYMERENISAGVFAMCSYLSAVSIYKILNGKKVGPGTSRKILIATKGEVDLNIPYKSKNYYLKNLPQFRNRIRAPKKEKKQTLEKI